MSLYMSRAIAVPLGKSVEQALTENEAMQNLARRLAQSRACMDAVKADIPTPLHPYVEAGPVDEKGWTLIAANAAVASKLRQCKMAIESTLQRSCLGVCAVRIHIRQ